MAEKNCFDMTKLLFELTCVTVAQWSRSCFECADKPGSTPGDAVFCFFVSVFFLFGLFFLTLFFLLHSYCWPCWSCTWINIYFKLKSGVFCKRDFKSSSSAYLMAKLTTRKKTISCQDMSLLWNSWIVFSVSWHHDKQHTVHHKLY